MRWGLNCRAIRRSGWPVLGGFHRLPLSNGDEVWFDPGEEAGVISSQPGCRTALDLSSKQLSFPSAPRLLLGNGFSPLSLSLGSVSIIVPTATEPEWDRPYPDEKSRFSASLIPERSGDIMAPSVMSKYFNEAEGRSLQSRYRCGEVDSTILQMKEKTEHLPNVPIHIAVLGDVGSGKSTFINAIRGLRSDDPMAAPIGIDEASMGPTRYSYPSLPNVLLWDLPGANSAGFDMNRYLKQVQFEGYDFYIIVSQSRFREYDGVFSKKIQEQKKGFYYIRSKIDNDTYSMQMQGIEFSEGERQIHQDSYNNFQSLGVKPSAIFLISSLEVDKYDFPKLKSALATDLQSIKLNAFSLRVPNMFREIQEPKRRKLMKRLSLLTFLSALLGAVRVSGFPLLTVIGCTVTGWIYLRRQVCVSDRELHRLSNRVGKSFLFLEDAMRHRSSLKFVSLVPKAFLGSLIMSCTVDGFTHSLPPVAFSVCGSVTSFVFTFLLLKDSLNGRLQSEQNLAKRAIQPDWGDHP